jgi:hypothetical protein
MPHTYTAVALVTLAPEWLQMSRHEREAFNARHIAPVFARYAGRVDMRHVDVEAFTGACSDILIFRTIGPADFHDLWDELRDTPLFHQSYLTVNNVLFGVDAEWVDLPDIAVETTSEG